MNKPIESCSLSPISITLNLDDKSFLILDNLRKKYFPASRNFISAHVTLFHALPGEFEDVLKNDLALSCSKTPKMLLNLPNLLFLGNGVAVEVKSDAFKSFKQSLTDLWWTYLTNQDKHKTKPHVTIQNKVSNTVAKNLYNELSTNWQSIDAVATGITMWYYRGGPWEFIQSLNFI